MTKSPLEHHRQSFITNLVGLYSNASQSARADGIAWYPSARAIVRDWADHYGLPIVCVASVIAAISPQCDWSRNLIIADDVLAERPVSIGGAIQSNVTKARQLRNDAADTLSAIALQFPQGPKVNCFAANLAGDDTLVTVDTHATQAAYGDVTVTRTLHWTAYRIVAECYAHAAARVQVSPATFQAIIWHVWKEKYPRVRKIQVRSRW